MPIVRRPRFLERRVSRSARKVAGDPLAETKLAYVFNALASRLMPLDHWGLTEVQLLKELLSGLPANGGSVFDSRSQLTASLKDFLKEVGRDLCQPPPPADPLWRNLKVLGDFLTLDETERQILLLAVACKQPDVAQFFRTLPHDALDDLPAVVADLVALPVGAVREALRPAGLLRMSGVITLEAFGWLGDRFVCDARLWSILSFPRMTREHLWQRFVEAASPATLAPADFAHLAPEVGRAISLLRTALAERTAGVNLLLYGPTGTGKSELARVLAAALDVPLLQAGIADDRERSPTAQERLGSLLVGNRMARAVWACCSSTRWRTSSPAAARWHRTITTGHVTAPPSPSSGSTCCWRPTPSRPSG